LRKKIRCGKIPKFALARGLWLGEIPEAPTAKFCRKIANLAESDIIDALYVLAKALHK